MLFLKALIFNTLFYGSTAILSVAILPTLLLPRRAYLRVLMVYFHWVTFLERVILGLSYRVEGKENLPKDGAYILGMKHQSAYETMKLHILFGDVTAILKRELLWIPIWGWHAAKLRLIPIDRSARGKAIPAMIDSARTLIEKDPHRPIVIFPQGTRVAPGVSTDDRPYKIGIVRLYEALNIPIVPVALNAGLFWGRNAFLKRGGVVTFKILPPIAPGGAEQETLKTLTDSIEGASNSLIEQADRDLNTPRQGGFFVPLLLTVFFLFLGWAALWHQAANRVETHLQHWVSAAEQRGFAINWQDKSLGGFPGPIHMQIDDMAITSLAGGIRVPQIRAQAWPLPGALIHASLPLGLEQSTLPITVRAAELRIEGLIPGFGQEIDAVTLTPLIVDASPLTLNSVGKLTLNDSGLYNGSLTHDIQGGQAFLIELMDQRLISRTIGLLIENWVKDQGQEGANDSITIETPVKDGSLFLGPFRLIDIPAR